MKIKIVIALLSVLVISTAFQSKSTGTLTITIMRLQNSKGEVEAFLFNSKDGFPDDNKKVFKKVRAKITNGSCILTFENLPFGEYAGGAFHDENNNGKLDENFIGMPTEPIGLTNMQSLGVFNQPSYTKAKFQFNGSKEMKILLTDL